MRFSHAMQCKMATLRGALRMAILHCIAWEKSHIARGRLRRLGLTNECALGPQGKHICWHSHPNFLAIPIIEFGRSETGEPQAFNLICLMQSFGARDQEQLETEVKNRQKVSRQILTFFEQGKTCQRKCRTILGSNSSRSSQALGHYPRKPLEIPRTPAGPRRNPAEPSERPRRALGETPPEPSERQIGELGW